MRLERLPGDDATVTWGVSGEVDIFAASDLFTLLRRELDAEHDVVLDLSNVSFIESTGLGVLLGETKHAAERGLRLALRTNASRAVMQLLDDLGARDRFVWVPAGDGE